MGLTKDTNRKAKRVVLFLRKGISLEVKTDNNNEIDGYIHHMRKHMIKLH